MLRRGVAATASHASCAPMNGQRRSSASAARTRSTLRTRGAVAHEADAPGFAGHDAEAGADFDAVFFEQALAQRRVVGAGGNVDAVQRVQRMLRNVAEADVSSPARRRWCICAWRAMRCFEAFLEHDARAPRAARRSC